MPLVMVSNLGKENRRVQKHPSRYRRDQRARRPRGRADRSERAACAVDADCTSHATTLCAVRARHHDVTNGPRRQNAADTSADSATDQSADIATDQFANLAANASAADAAISSDHAANIVNTGGTRTRTTNHVARADQFDGAWTCSGRSANSWSAGSKRRRQSAIADHRQPGNADDNAGWWRHQHSGRTGHDPRWCHASMPAGNASRDDPSACALNV